MATQDSETTETKGQAARREREQRALLLLCALVGEDRQNRLIHTSPAFAEVRAIVFEHLYEEKVEHLGATDALVARLYGDRDALLEALKTSRGQWIHSVNAELCLAAIARAEGRA